MTNRVWLQPRPKPLTPARQNDVAVRTAPSTVSAVSAKKIVLVLSDASGYDLRDGATVKHVV